MANNLYVISDHINPGDIVEIDGVTEELIAGVNVFNSIQDAIQKAATNNVATTINVYDGTYSENLFFLDCVVGNNNPDIEIKAGDEYQKNVVISGDIQIGKHGSNTWGTIDASVIAAKGVADYWNGTVTFDGVTLSGDKLIADLIEADGDDLFALTNCTVKGVNVQCGYCKPVITNCDFISESNTKVAYVQTKYLANNDLEINGGTFTDARINMVGESKTGTAKIEGVTFNSTVNPTKTGDVYTGSFYVIRTDNGTNLDITDCDFTIDSAVAADAQPKDSGDWAVIWARAKNGGDTPSSVAIEDCSVSFTAAATAMENLFFVENTLDNTVANTQSVNVDDLEATINSDTTPVTGDDATAALMSMHDDRVDHSYVNVDGILYSNGELVAKDHLYVNAAWTDAAHTPAQLDADTPLVFGVNAFKSIGTAAKVVPTDDDVKITLGGETYQSGAASFNDGQTVVIDGTAALRWKDGFFFVGRGDSGQTADPDAVTTVTFRNATITTYDPVINGISSTGFHVSSAAGTGKNNGVLNIENSTMTCDYLINRNETNIVGSDVTFVNMYVHGRNNEEARGGKLTTATLTISNYKEGGLNKASNVTLTAINGLSLGAEGNGVINVKDTSSFSITANSAWTIADYSKDPKPIGDALGEGKGTLNLTDTATFTAVNKVINQGEINMTAGNTFTALGIDNTGTITIDAAGFTLAGEGTLKKVIDLSQNKALTGVTVNNLGEGLKVAYASDGDVLIHNISLATLYVDAGWTDKQSGEVIDLGGGKSAIFGVNAFANVDDVFALYGDKDHRNTETTEVVFLSDVTATATGKQYFFSDVNVAFTAASNVTVDMRSFSRAYMMGYYEVTNYTGTPSSVPTFTIGENVTMVAKVFMAGQSIDDEDVDANGDATRAPGAANVIVNGTISAGQTYAAAFSNITTGTAGVITIPTPGSGDAMIIRAQGTITVTGNGEHSLLQFNPNYVGNQGGILTLKDTYGRTGLISLSLSDHDLAYRVAHGQIIIDNSILYSTNALDISDAEGTMTLKKGSELSLAKKVSEVYEGGYGLGGSNAGTIEILGSSKLIAKNLTNTGVITIDATSSIGAEVANEKFVGTFTNSGTINIEVGGTISAGSFVNNDGAVINIDVKEFEGTTADIILANGTGKVGGTINLVNNEEKNFSVIRKSDNSVSIAVIGADVFINSGWEGVPEGTEVSGNGHAAFIGMDAFYTIGEAIDTVGKNIYFATSDSLDASFTGKLNGSKLLRDTEVSSAVTVSMGTDSAQSSLTGNLEIGAGVTFAAKRLYQSSMDSTITVNGTFQAVSPSSGSGAGASLYGGAMAVSETGRITGSEIIVRSGANGKTYTLAVTGTEGGWTAENPQVDVAALYIGKKATATFTDTVVEADTFTVEYAAPVSSEPASGVVNLNSTTLTGTVTNAGTINADDATIIGNVANTGTINFSDTANTGITGNVTNDGTMNLGEARAVVVNGNIVNGGTVNLKNDSTLQAETITNNGTFAIEGTRAGLVGAVSNASTIDIAAGQTLAFYDESSLTNDAAGIVNVAGTLDAAAVENNGTINVANGAAINADIANTGTISLSGTGDFTGTLTGGTLVLNGATFDVAGRSFTSDIVVLGTTEITGGLSTTGDFTVGSDKNGSATISDGKTLTVDGTVGIGLGTGTGALNVSFGVANDDLTGKVTADAITIGSNGTLNLSIDAAVAEISKENVTYTLVDVTGDSALSTANITVNGTKWADAEKTFGNFTLMQVGNDIILTNASADVDEIFVNAAWINNSYGDVVGKDMVYGINAFSTLTDALYIGSSAELKYVTLLSDVDFTGSGYVYLYSDYTIRSADDTETEAIEKYNISWHDGCPLLYSGVSGESFTVEFADSVNVTVANGYPYFGAYVDSTLLLNGTATVEQIWAVGTNGTYTVGTTGKLINRDEIHIRGAVWNVNGTITDTANVNLTTDAQVSGGWYWNSNNASGAIVNFTNTYVNIGTWRMYYNNGNSGRVLLNASTAVLKASEMDIYQDNGSVGKDTGHIFTFTESSRLIASTVNIGKDYVDGETTTVSKAFVDIQDSSFEVSNAVVLASGGTIGLTDSTMSAKNVTNNGEINVSGTATLDITTLSGSGVTIADGATIKDSTVGGTVNSYIDKAVTFVGDNSFAGFDLNNYNASITVGAGDSLTVTKNRLTLGYSLNFSVTGEIEDALTADKTQKKLSLDYQPGFSINGDGESYFTVEDAYVKLGSTTPKPSGAKGTYFLSFTNSIVDTNSYKMQATTNPVTIKTTFDGSVLYNNSHLTNENVGAEMVFKNRTQATVTGSFKNGGNFQVLSGSQFTANGVFMNQDMIGENYGNTGSILVDGTGSVMTLKNNKGTLETICSRTVDAAAPASITVTNGGTFNVGTIYNEGAITIDALSLLSGNQIIKNIESATITIDAAGLDAGSFNKVIDLNQSASLEGSVTLTDPTETARLVYGNDGDVWVTNIALDKLYVGNWENVSFGKEVTLADGKTKAIFGVNAFNSFVTALNEITDATTEIQLQVASITEDNVAAPAVYFNHDVAITKSASLQGNASVTLNVTDNSSTAPDTDGKIYFLKDAETESAKLTFGEGVILNVPEATGAEYGSATYFGYNTGNGMTVEIAGQVNAYVFYNAFYTNLTVTPTGSISSSEMFTIRFGATVTFNGNGDGTTKQGDFCYLNQYGGIINLNDTVVDAGDWYQVWNRNNVTPSDIQLNLTDSTLTAGSMTIKNNASGYLVNLDNSTISVSNSYTNAGVLTLTADSDISTKTFTNSGTVDLTDSTLVVTTSATNNGTFTVSGDSLLTIGTLVGTITVNADADLTGSVVGGTGDIAVAAGKTLTLDGAVATSFGAITNNGTIDIDGALVNLGAITNNGSINMDWDDQLTFSGYTRPETAYDAFVNIDLTGYEAPTEEHKLILDYTGTGSMDAAAYMNMIGKSEYDFNRYFEVDNNDLYLKVKTETIIKVGTNEGDVPPAEVQDAVTTAKASSADLEIENGTFAGTPTTDKPSVSTVTFESVNTTIDSGTFNANVIGGSNAYSVSGKHPLIDIPEDGTMDTSLTIKNGTFNKMVVGSDRFEQGEVLYRYGNSNLTIEGGTFKNAVAAGIAFAQAKDSEGKYKYASAHAELDGNVNLTIRGGTFEKFVYGGCIAGTKNQGYRTTIDGDVTVTLDVAAANTITFQQNLVVGSFGNGNITGDVTLVVTGAGTIRVASGSQIWGGCSADYYYVDGKGVRQYETNIDGNRILSFTGFTGTLDCESIRSFDTVLANGSAFNLNDTVILDYVNTWEIGDSTIGGAFRSDFTGDTLTLTSLSDGIIFGDVSRFLLTKTEGDVTESLFGAVQYKDAADTITAMNFDGVSEWASEGGEYRLYLANNTETGKTEMRFAIATA